MTYRLLTYPSITAVYAAIFALIFVALSGWIVAGRVRGNALFGDGGNQELQKKIRIQANFAEYVPFALLLIALLEARGAGPVFINLLLIVLLVARTAHRIGMLAPQNSPQQFGCRGGGIAATLGVIVVTALALIVTVI